MAAVPTSASTPDRRCTKNARLCTNKRQYRDQFSAQQQRASRNARKYFELESGRFVLRQNTDGVPIRPIDLLSHDEETNEYTLKTYASKDDAIAFEERCYERRVNREDKEKFIPMKYKIKVRADQHQPAGAVEAAKMKATKKMEQYQLAARRKKLNVDIGPDNDEAVRFRQNVEGAFYRLHKSDHFNSREYAPVHVPDAALYEKVILEATDQGKVFMRTSGDSCEEVSDPNALLKSPPYKDTWAILRTPENGNKKHCLVATEPQGGRVAVRLRKNKKNWDVQARWVTVDLSDLKLCTNDPPKKIEKKDAKVEKVEKMEAKVEKVEKVEKGGKKRRAANAGGVKADVEPEAKKNVNGNNPKRAKVEEKRERKEEETKAGGVKAEMKPEAKKNVKGE